MSPKREARVARLGAIDVVAMVWRERWTGLAVAMIILVLGAAAILFSGRGYEARADIRVEAEAANPQVEQVVHSERRLLASPEVARRTIARIGLKRLYPKLADGTFGAQANAEKAFARDFSVAAAAEPGVIALAFVHPDRQIAAQTLDALTAEYLAYRRRITPDPMIGGYAAHARDFTRRSEASAATLQALLADRGIADFDGALRSATELLARLDLEAAAAAAERRALEARAEALRQRRAAEPATIELSADTDAGKRTGLAHRGPNPVRQTLQTDIYEAEAGVRAQIARGAALAAEKVTLAAHVARLRAIEPKVRALQRERDILDDNARAFASRAEEARVFSALKSVATDRIHQVAPARATLHGQRARRGMAFAVLVLALATSFVAALMRGLDRISFPTASSAARTLEAPVLGVAVQRRAA